MLYCYALVFLVMRTNVNVSNTAILNVEQCARIRKQLGNLSSPQWAWAVGIFWCPYMLSQPRFSPTYRVNYPCCIVFIAMNLGAILTAWCSVRKQDAAEKSVEFERILSVACQTRGSHTSARELLGGTGRGQREVQ
jgi:hypothetical protein